MNLPSKQIGVAVDDADDTGHHDVIFERQVESRPILMSAPMVRALLAGTKTQTRRIMKPQPSPDLASLYNSRPIRCHELESDDGMPCGYGVQGEDWHHQCRYGKPGDRLWVRETVAIAYSYAGNPHVCFRADGDVELHPDHKWTPSIHMPRWASRLTLEITDVRVERLNEISDADCFAEGIEEAAKRMPADGTARGSYRALWESINGPGSWDLNPWVWVISFKRITEH